MGDNAVCACQTQDGGYAILAASESNDGDVSATKGRGNLWLLKIDNSGNLIWGKTYGSSSGDIPISLANTADNGFILFGASNGSDGDIPFHYAGAFSLDWLVIKTDAMGDKQWSKTIGGTGDEQYSGSILSVDNSYYLVSGTTSRDYDCADTAWHAGVNTGDDYHLLKLDDTGKVLWDSSYGGTSTDVPAYAMYDVRDSTIVMNGYTWSPDYMVTGYQGGQGDMWVVKVNKNGTLIWQKTLGSPHEDGGTGICPAPNGGYMAYGDTHDGSIGVEKLWLFELGNGGNIVENKLFGGPTLTGNTSFSVVPYLNGWAATGQSGAELFTEGTTYGNFDHGGPFVSYIGAWPVQVKKIYDTTHQSMAAYPNPSSEKIRISIPGNMRGNMFITNNIGQEVYNQHNNAPITKDIEVNIAAWANGLYLIVWSSEDGTMRSMKFVKM